RGMRPPAGRSNGGTSGVCYTHEPHRQFLTLRELDGTMSPPAGRPPARLPGPVSVLAAIRELGRAGLGPGRAEFAPGRAGLGPGRAELAAGSAELEPGGVELEPGDGELERGRGGVPAAPAGHRGGERAGTGLGGRDPVAGDDDEPARGVDLAGIAGLA